MEHCGEIAAPYNWAGHTCSGGPGYSPTPGYLWGMFISAPARDLVNDVQPGRPKDICIGTNPVTLKFSQKGSGEALVTLAPELVLKAGLVGGGGSYNIKSNCINGSGDGGSGGTLRCGLGKVWRESESGWTGTWRRRGESNVFDAHWDKPGWQSLDQILTVSVSGGKISIYRQDPNIANNTCSYSGVVGSDGVSVSGEYICNNRGVVIGPAKWNATIDCVGGSDDKCSLAGNWSQIADGIGGSTWTITDSGRATESGLGRATGTARLTGTTLRIDWSIGSSMSGIYEWNLDSNCRSGSGTLTFTSGRSGSTASRVARQ
jgi:hypothetical protein